MEPIVRRLLAIGLASLALYILLAIRYPLEPSLVDYRASWVSLNGGSIPWSLAQIAMYLGLVLLYMAALDQLNRLSRKELESGSMSPGRQRWVNVLIVSIWLGCSLVLLTVAPAGESHDLFDYVFRGRMMAEFNANPLLDLPKEYSNKAFYLYIAWHSQVDAYGPIWEATSNGLANFVRLLAQLLGWWVLDLPSCPESQASCRLFMLYIFGYRLIAIGLTGLCAWFIARLVKNSQPEMGSTALAAWLLNPLTLIVTAVGAHNDLWMIVLLLAGILLMQKRSPFWALVALILAMHVKLTALIWAPVFGLWILAKWGWRRTMGVGICSLLAGLVISWLLYQPFGGWSTLPRMLQERALYFANSIWIIFNKGLTQLGFRWRVVDPLTVNLSTVLFLTASLWVTFISLNFVPKRWKKLQFELEERRFWMVLVSTSLLYLFLGAFWFQHWYFLWLIAPAALLPGSRFTIRILPWLCFGGLAANLGSNMINVFLDGRVPDLLTSVITVGMIWGPGLTAFVLDRSDLRNFGDTRRSGEARKKAKSQGISASTKSSEE